LEKYLSEHAEHFIDSIGRNAWTSMFETKILPEVKAKCHSKQNDIAAAIRHALFTVFSKERLNYVDCNTPFTKLAE
ncbi:15913_t:CDS:2, partial [Racocetra fulgida]